jgi:pimeloyl-ACP methyl ester carboxylesterase
MLRSFPRLFLNTTIPLLIVGMALIAVTDVDAAEKASPSRATPELLVVFIGGMDSDPTPAEIAGTERENRGNSGMFQLCRKLNDNRLVCEYFNWNGTRAGNIQMKTPLFTSPIIATIHEHIRQYPHSRIVLVGNSWGGHTAWQVAEEMARSDHPLAIKQVIFLDASSAGRAVDRHPKQLPINISHAVHYYTHNVYCWGQWTGDRIHAVDLGDPKLGYCKNGTPNYASKFDFRAHVAAEWDARIHNEIKAAVMKLVTTR